MTQAELRILRQQVGTLNWTTNYIDFCRILKLDPEFEHAREKWAAFQDLHRSLSSLGALFDKLLETTT